MNLNNQQIKEAHDLWKNQYPNSKHQLDTDRFIKLCLVLLENGDTIDATEIETSLGQESTESNVQYYFEIYQTVKSTYDLMLDSGYTK